jgi:Rieske Fe-S protein
MILDRREFLKSGCLACIGASIGSITLSGCAFTHYVSGSVAPNGINILKSDFIDQKKEKATTRQFIVVQNDKLAFPIYVYRISENEYSAIWMQCSHQGNELQALGDQLHCPAHGSEFDSQGKVTQGPASHDLRKFPVSANGDTLFIDLRAS